MAFGHKFTDRCGHIQGDGKEVSPIFTQFLGNCLPLCISLNKMPLTTKYDMLSVAVSQKAFTGLIFMDETNL